MKALICERLDGPDALRIGDMPKPAPGPGELLLRVTAAAVNFPDGLIVQGRYQIKPPVPFIPGSEAVGIVEAIGEGVTDFAPGDRAAILTLTGAFAQYVVGAAASAMRVPPDLPSAKAAALQVTYGTAYHALVQKAQVLAGETILILGAGGGVGLAAVELARRLGCRVIAAASSADKLAVARAAGADITIRYGGATDLKAAVREATGGAGVDVVYDPVGGDFAEPALRSIAWGGRYLVIGFAAGDIPRLPINLILLKNAAMLGVIWGEWVRRNPLVNRANLDAMTALVLDGGIDPHIDKIFPFDRAAEAIRYVLDRKAIGKVVIAIDETGPVSAG